MESLTLSSQMSEEQRREKSEDLAQRLAQLKYRPNRKEFMVERKKDWYKIEKRILQKFPVKIHKESRVSARRTYMFYNVAKGDWEGPSPREFGKMKKEKWEQLCVDRIVNKGPWEDPLLEESLSSAASTWPLEEGLVGSCDFGLRKSHDLQEA